MTSAASPTPVVVALALALTVLVAAPGLAASEADPAPTELRTDAEGLGGFTITGTATPLVVEFFEPVIPAQVEPGEPHFEASESYTSASLSTGPTSRALASSLWPGPLLGDGLGTLVEGQVYPVKADARYPQGPEEERLELPGGSGMRASARGLDVLAEATSARSPSRAAAHFGNVASTSGATVEDAIARSRVRSAVTDVALLEGLITVAGVRTELEASSDGATAATGGVTEVTGLAIAGQGFVVDEQGVRAVEDGAPGKTSLPVPSSLPDADQLRELLGVVVELVPHSEAVEAADASRSAGGVRITVDTAAMRAALAVLPIGELVDAVPDDVAARVAPLLQLSPRIVYVLGRGEVRAVASRPLDLGVPDPAVTAPSPGGRDEGFLAAPGPPPAPDAPPGPATAPPEAPTRLMPPAVAPPVPSSAGRGLPALFAGIPPAAVAIAVALTGLAAYGLSGLTTMAFGGSASACALGASRRVPDLRRRPGAATQGLSAPGPRDPPEGR